MTVRASTIGLTTKKFFVINTPATAAGTAFFRRRGRRRVKQQVVLSRQPNIPGCRPSVTGRHPWYENKVLRQAKDLDNIPKLNKRFVEQSPKR